MPTPMTPSKPLTPAAALAQKAQANLAASGGANVPAGQNSTADKLKALASGEDPNAPLGAKTPGDKAFSIITPKDPNGTMHIFAKNAQDAKVKYKQLGDPLGGATQAVEIKETDVAEGFDKWGWHTSVDNGEFVPTKYGNKNYVYLHDLDSESPNGGPQLVTFNKPTHAKRAASKFGGKVVKTDLNTYRVVKPVEQVAEGSEERSQNRLWAMITDYEKRAKATKNDIKKAHYMKMAGELRGKLKTSDEQGVAEGQNMPDANGNYKFHMMAFLRNGDIKEFNVIANGDRNAKILAKKKLIEKGYTKIDSIHIQGMSPVHGPVNYEIDRSKRFRLESQGVAEGSDKLQGTPVVSLSDFDAKDTKKNKYGQTVPKKLKKDDPRVKFHKDQKQGMAEAGYETPGDKVAKKLEKIARKGASQIGWEYSRDSGGSLSKDELDPYGNYKQGWIQKNKPTHKPHKTSKSKDMEESMTTLKTTFEGIEDSIASILESFGLENGRDFYIDGTIRTLDEQVAQDILSVLADHDLPGQANLRQLDEGWAISLIGQGEELVENLTVGNDDIEIRHIGEGVVRVYVNHELAEQFDTGTAAFKYVKALQQNLAEADNELMSALSAEAGEDLMKIDKITEGWSEWEEKKASYKKAGATVDGKEDDYTVTSKDGSRKRYQNTKSGRKVTSLPPVEGKGEVDSEGNKVKRGRGRPKKVRESLEAIRTMRKQVTEALAKIDRLPEAQRNTPQVQAMVDRLTESVKKAIARAK